MRTPAFLPRLCITLLLALQASGCQSAGVSAQTGIPAGGPAYAKAGEALNPNAATGAISTEMPAGPSRIAVLLPLHGKLAAAGTALQRGMLAAWYSDREKGLPVPALDFHDSSRSDFPATYDAAVAAGAQLVIGPLEKENLRLLQQRGQLPVPTLALNYAENEQDALPANLYFIGLAGEDEAAQIARALAEQKLARAAILFPAADWGQRIAREFEETLQSYGGRVQARGSYTGNGDYTDVVRRLLDVGASELRHARLQQVVGVPLVFQPTRRQDIDSLLLVANTPQAAQIVPALQYHYGGGIPLFATSHINSQVDGNTAGDLNGIRFLEMPWIIDATLPLRQLVTQSWEDPDPRYTRLHALGVDALLAGRLLPALSADSSRRLEGMSGVLSMDSRHALHRQLSWMIFREGRMERLDATP